MESLLLIPAPSLVFGCGEFSRPVAKPERFGEGWPSRCIWAAGQDPVHALVWAPPAWGAAPAGWGPAGVRASPADPERWVEMYPEQDTAH